MNEKKQKQNPMKEIYGFAEDQKGKLNLARVISLFSVLIGFVPYICVAFLLNGIVNQQLASKDILILVVAALVGFLGKSGLFAVATVVSHKAAFHIIRNIRLKMMEKLSRLSMGKVQSQSSGEYKQLIIDDVERLEYPLAHVIPEKTGYTMLPVLVVLFLILIDFRIALAALASSVVGFIVYSGMMIGREKLMPQYMEANAHMNKTIVEYVNGMEVIKAFQQSASSYEQYKDSVSNVKNLTLKWYRHCWPFMSAGQAIMPSTISFILPVGILLLGHGALSQAELIISIVFSMGIVGSLQDMLMFRENEAVFHELAPKISDMLGQEELTFDQCPDKVSGNYDIELENVSFGYTETEIIHDVSLKIPERSVVALVGPSGSGKSTLARLLDRFWDVRSGNIRIGGCDIRQYSMEELTDKISYVSQDNFLFNMSIRDNIRIGRPGASDKDVEDAAQRAGCRAFIEKFKDGYDTNVKDAGKRLSGGEKQRVALARAILKNAPIIILDEASAFVDPENEAQIQQAVNQLTKSKTVIMIAHRLSTIKDADQIVVLEAGKITARGRHAELLETSDTYRHMWEAHLNTSGWAMKTKGGASA